MRESRLLLAYFFLSHAFLRDIDAGADVAEELPFGVETGDAVTMDPSIFSVGAPPPVFLGKRLAGVKGRLIAIEAARKILRVHPFGPAVAKLLLRGTSGEMQPGLVEIGAQFVRPRHPDHDRGRVAHGPKSRLAFLERGLGLTAIRDLSLQLAIHGFLALLGCPNILK